MRLPCVEYLLAREDACTLRSVLTRCCSVCSHVPPSSFGCFRECSVTLSAAHSHSGTPAECSSLACSGPSCCSAATLHLYRAGPHSDLPVSSHSHRNCKRQLNVCNCCERCILEPSYVPVVETYRLNHGVCDTGRGAAVRRYLRMYLPPNPADRDYRAGCLGAEVGLCFPRRDCDVRFRHACKCCTAIHAVTCRPVRRAVSVNAA